MSANDIIKEAFGRNCNLYTDVLDCPRDANPAALRRAYYRTALKYHPDKVVQQRNDIMTTNDAVQEANGKFHAITAAYQILCNVELRKEYDTTGVIPDTTDDDEDDEFNSSDKTGSNQWKEYFDRIFGKVTNSDIDLFASKYKCSEEEQRDVLNQYQQQKGNLSKMLHHVMLSEPVDVVRWVQDYINPAILNQTLTSQYNDTMQRTLQQIQTKIEKERKQKNSGKATTSAKSKEEVDDPEDEDDFEDDEHDDMDDDDDDDDDDETETDDEDELPPPPPPPPPPQPIAKKKKTTAAATTKSPKQKKTQPSIKAKRTKPTATTKTKKNNATDLISLIQNRRTNNADTWSDFGARYGVTIPEDDPIPDNATFQQIQSKLKTQKGKKK